MSSEHGPGLIGVTSGEILRCSPILTSVMGLVRPQETAFTHEVRFSVAENLNRIGHTFLDHADREWLLLVEDDHALPADTLTRLLAHELPVVSALYLSRKYPFSPVLYSHAEDDGGLVHRPLLSGERGPIPVAVVGCGCLLLRRRVLEAIPPPWFTYSAGEGCDHDVNFCRRVRARGFPIYCDLDCRVGHVGQMVMTPDKTPAGDWITRLEVQGGELAIASADRLPV